MLKALLCILAIMSNKTSFGYESETSMVLSGEEAFFGETFTINVSVTVGNETAQKPILEIHLPPNLRFSKASIVSTTCESSTNHCVEESTSLDVENGQLMGKFSLGNREIKATRSFVIAKGQESGWRQGCLHRSSVKLENVSSIDSDDNQQFAISVFRCWKSNTNNNAAVVAERSTGKYFLLHPANVSIRYLGGDQKEKHQISSQTSFQISLIAEIDFRAGRVVLKLIVPWPLIVEECGYGVGGNGSEATGAVMQTRNRTANAVELYVLLTPDALIKAGDDKAVLNVRLRARSTQSGIRLSGSVLYGTDFRNRVDARPLILDIADNTKIVQKEDLRSNAPLSPSREQKQISAQIIKAAANETPELVVEPYKAKEYPPYSINQVNQGNISIQNKSSIQPAMTMMMPGSTNANQIMQSINGSMTSYANNPSQITNYIATAINTSWSAIMSGVAAVKREMMPMLSNSATMMTKATSSLDHTFSDIAKRMSSELSSAADTVLSKNFTSSLMKAVNEALSQIDPAVEAVVSSAANQANVLSAINPDELVSSVKSMAMNTNQNLATDWSSSYNAILSIFNSTSQIGPVILTPNGPISSADISSSLANVPKAMENLGASIMSTFRNMTNLGLSFDHANSSVANESIFSDNAFLATNFSVSANATRATNSKPILVSNTTVAQDLISAIANLTVNQSNSNATSNQNRNANALMTSSMSNDSTTAGPCPAGWWTMDFITSGCYYFSKTQLSFREAEKECSQRGGHLPSFHSVYDFLGLSTFWTNSLRSTEIWIGLSLNASLDRWKWVDDSRLDYVDWCDDYPIADSSRNCAICSMATNDNYCWRNRVCEQSLYFFCTKPRKDYI